MKRITAGILTLMLNRVHHYNICHCQVQALPLDISPATKHCEQSDNQMGVTIPYNV